MQCRVCWGRGEVFKGVVQVLQPDGSLEPYLFHRVCPVCHGSGRVDPAELRRAALRAEAYYEEDAPEREANGV